jgi:Dolichyl-phosphate-mannose-protein mannosyltransferase
LKTVALFAVLAVLLIVSHAPLLRLPYFWDEAGYYIPAARDLLAGSLIPYSTPSNAHPPLVMAWLALGWKIFGQSQLVTRCAMLLLAAFSLTGFFRLAKAVSNSTVAVASTLLTAIYPVFFAQSSLAQVDLAAAGFTFWALEAHVRRRNVAMAIWFSLAALAKETAILVPLALVPWEDGRFFFGQHPAKRIKFWDSEGAESAIASSPSAAKAGQVKRHSGTAESRALPGRADERLKQRELHVDGLFLLIPIVPLALWYAYHYAKTGFVFGNPEFFRYNVQGNFHVLRIFLALLLRIWQTVGYLNMYVLTLACVLAMKFPALPRASGGFGAGEDRQPTMGGATSMRQRVATPVQLSFLAIAVVYLLALSVIGGAVLARYMLPIAPLFILVCVSTIWRRLPAWKAVLVVAALAFIGALFFNPPYGFSPEDNLAYRDYIWLHQGAETFVEVRYPHARVLTAWPASDELSRPNLGYVGRPLQVVRIEDFTAEQLLAAADERERFDIALVFSTKYQPAPTFFDRWRLWQELKALYFGYHVDLSPETAASVLGGNLVYVERTQGQWVGVIEMQKIEEARFRASTPSLRLGAEQVARMRLHNDPHLSSWRESE